MTRLREREHLQAKLAHLTSKDDHEHCNMGVNLYNASKDRSISLLIIMPPSLGYGALCDDERLTFVCLSRTSGLSREQRGLGRLKLE